MNAIETDELSKVYDSFLFWKGEPALNRLTINVPEGTVFGYLGPNGAGKTTTLRLLLGLTRPSSGTAKILGEDSSDPSVRNRVGYLAESANFYDYMKASEFLDYFARIFKMDKATREQKIIDLLAFVGLKDKASAKLKTFSKGMLQRIGFAQAMINDPDLLLLDEPMTGLDPIGRREFKDMIKRVSKEEGKTVFFCSHVLADAEEVCDRVGIVSKGNLLVQDKVDNLLHIEKELITTKNASARLISSLQEAGFPAEKKGDTVVVTADAGDPAEVVRQHVRDAGGSCDSTELKRETLEEFFVRIVSEAEREG